MHLRFSNFRDPHSSLSPLLLNNFKRSVFKLTDSFFCFTKATIKSQYQFLISFIVLFSSTFMFSFFFTISTIFYNLQLCINFVQCSPEFIKFSICTLLNHAEFTYNNYFVIIFQAIFTSLFLWDKLLKDYCDFWWYPIFFYVCVLQVPTHWRLHISESSHLFQTAFTAFTGETSLECG